MEKPANEERDPVLLAARAAASFQDISRNDCHVLISCSKSKGTHSDVARNMYVSPLYRKSVLLTEAWGFSFSILSAKYGLLSPDAVIDPYDLTLKGSSKEFKAEWGQRVDAQIRSRLGASQQFVVFAGDDYYVPLLNAGEEESQLRYLAPMRGLSLGNRLAFLNESKSVGVSPPLLCALIRSDGKFASDIKRSTNSPHIGILASVETPAPSTKPSRECSIRRCHMCVIHTGSWGCSAVAVLSTSPGEAVVISRGPSSEIIFPTRFQTAA
ncbi:hypothetical protein ACVW1A_002357 [Bradyrhizobium sp. LB1.3]